MARPERNDVDYFPHYCNHGKGMFYIRQKHGNDGYAVWFMLLEHLGRSNFHYLDFSKEVQVLFLSSELMVSKEKLLEIVEDLVLIEAFDHEFWETYNIVYSEKFTESVKDAYRKRSNECLNRAELIELMATQTPKKADSSAVNPVKGTVKPQRREEKRKEEKRRVKESIENYVFSLKEIPEYFFLRNEKFYALFLEHCNLKDVVKTDRAIVGRLKSIQNFDMAWAINRVETAIQRNWKGLVFDTDIAQKKQDQPTGPRLKELKHG